MNDGIIPEDAQRRWNMETGFRRLATVAFCVVGGWTFAQWLFSGHFWYALFWGAASGGIAYGAVRGLGWAWRGFLGEP